MKQLRIVLINNLYTPNLIGGAERSVQSLAEALVKIGCDVTVICLDRRYHVEIINGVRVYYLKLFNCYWPFTHKRNKFLKYVWQLLDCYNIFMAIRVYGILRKENIDIVNTHNLAGFSVAVWSAVNMLKLPLVHTIRDYYLICPRASMYVDGCNCNKQCNICKLSTYQKLKLSSRIKNIIGISGYIADKHTTHGYFKNKYLNIIHNSYEKEPSNIKPIKIKKVVFGYIGRLCHTKGIEYLLENIKSDKIVAGARLLVAGEGNPDFLKRLKHLSAGADVVFLGETPPELFFDMIDVLVVPSLWNEPLGRIVFEAYAHGIPVISSNRGGIPEIVDHCKTGFIFDPDSPSSLIEAMKKICLHPELALEMKQNCIGKSRDFLPESIARQYLQVFSGVLRYGPAAASVEHEVSEAEIGDRINAFSQ
jgi:glycosyltransferase involved in cell wall biosynthesis